MSCGRFSLGWHLRGAGGSLFVAKEGRSAKVLGRYIAASHKSPALFSTQLSAPKGIPQALQIGLLLLRNDNGQAGNALQ